MNKFALFIASVAAFATTACTSYEIDMPENPAVPVVGNEVSSNVIYQANPRFFGTQDCLKGLQGQLPRIADMGTDILWIMPVYEPGELKSIGSPYCVRNFTALNPRYGSMADLKAVVNDAHAKGMKVIFDWVANHTAWDCAWITEHPNWYDQDAAGNIVAPNGWPDVAQLNLEVPEAAAAMKAAMLYWVNELKIDGYRCDFADGVPHAFWKSVIDDIRAINPDAIMLAESTDNDFYADGFNMIYDWNCAPTLSKVFNGGKPADAIKEAKDAMAIVPDGKSILRYVFNHDVAAENNVATMYGAPEGVPAAYVLASMLNGTPMVYSSMDVEGLSGKLSFFDYRSMDFSTTLSDVYRNINGAFKASADVRRGQLTDYSNNSVACFTRVIPGGHYLLVMVNTTADDVAFKTPITLTGATMTNLMNETSEVVPVVMNLGAYEYAILMN